MIQAKDASWIDAVRAEVKTGLSLYLAPVSAIVQTVQGMVSTSNNMQWKARFSGPRLVPGGRIGFYLDPWSPGMTTAGSPPVGSVLLLEMNGPTEKVEILAANVDERTGRRTLKIRVGGEVWALSASTGYRLFDFGGAPSEEWQIVEKVEDLR